MCGIVGIFNFKTGRPADPDLLRRLTGTVRHRGPDHEAVFADGEFGFAMARLSILGGQEGDQPLFTRDGRHGLVFNGEIYNFQELAREMGLRTGSDTRTLLELAARDGVSAFARMSGMFACALFDLRERTLLLARDHFGKKPLFVAETPDGVAFSSVVKTFAQLPGFDTGLDPRAVSAFLSMGYVPSNLSSLRGVAPLPAGTWRKWGGKSASGCFFLPGEPSPEPAVAGDFLPLFQRAVERRLVSDVPIGIFLSGGLDSNAVLTTALERRPTSIAAAFTLGLDGHEDESATAARTCAHFGIPLERVTLSPRDVLESFDHIVSATDNLLANPPMFALDKLSRVAAGSLKVVLTGGGGDELFFGYPTWKADWIHGIWRHAPQAFNQALARLLDLLPVSYAPHAPTYALRRLLGAGGLDPRRAHAWWRILFGPEELAALGVASGQCWDTAYQEAYAQAECRLACPVRQTALADLLVWWQCMGLYLTDAVPMGRGLEARSPFMDVDLARWTWGMALDELYHPLSSKPFLRKALSGLVPDWVRRGRKRPFHVPLGPWLRGPLSEFMNDLLSRENVARQGLLDPWAVQATVREHLSGQRDNSFKLLALLVLARWRDLVYQGGT